MSDVFEGIVVRYPIARFRRAFARLGPASLGYQLIGLDNYSVADRTVQRTAPFSASVEAVALQLSQRYRPGVLLYRYDSRIGLRESCFFRAGSLVSSFGERDELWVPTDREGMPIRSHPPMSASELLDDVEYATIMNAIDLGLQQLAGDDLRWEDLHETLAHPGEHLVPPHGA